MNLGDCKKCGVSLTKDNIRKYKGYINKTCKDCLNAYGRELHRKKAKALKESRWF